MTAPSASHMSSSLWAAQLFRQASLALFGFFPPRLSLWITFVLWDSPHHISVSVFSYFLQGTANNQTGIFPESFVKIIKPLPESDSEGEGGGHTYSCLRCFLLTPSGVETRSVWSTNDVSCSLYNIECWIFTFIVKERHILLFSLPNI